MSSKSTGIEIILSAVDRGLSAAVSRAEMAVSTFNKTAGNGIRLVNALEGAIGGVIGAFAGMAALRSVTEMMTQAGQASFDMEASIRAANREFTQIGTVESWGASVGRLSGKLQVYSDTAIKSAVSRTVDMTKRLGLSAEQMERVIELTGNLSAGKTDLNGGIERVTAALRGEAEASEYLGLTLNENYVKAWYNAKGAILGAWKDLNDMQKAQVRYQVFLEQSIPMQGRAAESAKTFGGALQLVRKEIDNAVVNNPDAQAAMQQLASTFRENSGAVGTLVSSMVTAAAKTAEWILIHRDSALAIGEWAAKIYVGIKALQGLGVVSNTIKGVSAALTVLTGKGIGPWVKSLAAGLGQVNLGALSLSGVLKSLGGVAAAAFVGWEIGTMLNKFDIVKKAGLTAAHGLTMAWLGVKKAWAWASGGDTGAVSREMDAARQAYSELMAEIDAGADDSKNKRIAAEQGVAAAVKDSAKEQEQATTSALDNMAAGQKAYADQVKELEKEMSAARAKADLAAKGKTLDLEKRGATGAERRQVEAETTAGKVQGIDAEISKYEGLQQNMGLKTAPSDEDRTAAEEVEKKLIALRGERLDLLRQEEVAKRQAAKSETDEKAKLERAETGAASQRRLQAIELAKIATSDIGDERARIEQTLALDRAAMAERIRLKQEELAELRRLAAEEKDESEKRKLGEQILDKQTELGGLDVERQRADAAGSRSLAEFDERARKEQDAAADEERKRQEALSEEQRTLAEKVAQEDEAGKAKAEQRDQARREQAEAAGQEAAESERQRQEMIEAAAEAAKEQLSQLQAEQARAAEERMAREQAATEKAKGIFQQYADRVKTLQDEIAGREQSLKDDLAEMDPNADEETKWRRRAAEAKNYEKAAKAAQQAGNLEEAKTLADQAREAYKGLGSGAAGIDEKTAKMTAFAGVKSAGALGLDIAKLLPEALKQSAQLDLSKVEGLGSRAQAMVSGQMAGMAGESGQGQAKPAQVHEIRLGRASLQGSPADVSEFLRQLELAGMSA